MKIFIIGSKNYCSRKSEKSLPESQKMITAPYCNQESTYLVSVLHSGSILTSSYWSCAPLHLLEVKKCQRKYYIGWKQVQECSDGCQLVPCDIISVNFHSASVFFPACMFPTISWSHFHPRTFLTQLSVMLSVRCDTVLSVVLHTYYTFRPCHVYQ